MINLSKANFKVEILAGLTTFFSCAYIITVVPSILANTGASVPALITSTILASSVSSIAMGLYANRPFVLGPGIGVNVFVTFYMVGVQGVAFEVALGAVFYSGILFLLLSIFKVREAIVMAIPKSLKLAIGVGIGFFITFIGFINSGLIDHHPTTMITLSKFDVKSLTIVLGLFITAYLLIKRTVGGLLISIIVLTILSIPLGRLWGDMNPVVTYNGIISLPDTSLIMALDFKESLKWTFLPAFFSIVFVDLFDSLATFIGVSHVGGMVDKKGNPKKLTQSLLVDAFGSTISGLFGVTAVTTYIESAVGVLQGGRTGLTAVVAGLCFLPFLFISPIISSIPMMASAPVLILVGSFMIKPILDINWDKVDEAIPAFLSIVVIAFTCSITNGIIAGFISCALCKIFAKKSKELTITFYIICVICIALFALEQFQTTG